MNEELNEGVQIILNRMESNPEEFFDAPHNKWKWMYSETFRDVMTEPEKAALHGALRKVRRLEITAKAVASAMPEDEGENTIKFKADGRYVGQGLTTTVGSNGASFSSNTVTRAEWEAFKAKHGTSN